MSTGIFQALPESKVLIIWNRCDILSGRSWCPPAGYKNGARTTDRVGIERIGPETR